MSSIQNPFKGKLLPAVKNGGFRMEDKMIWCGSVVKGEDGRYHMFASMWDRSMGFGANWLYHCKIVRAVSDCPEGPFRFEEVVIGPRGREYFDGMNAHNPYILCHKGTYYLYYMGTTYGGDIAPDVDDRALFCEVWNRKRIGLAVAESVYGPWKRFDEPILSPRDCRFWDCTAVTNPAAAILPDGQTYLLYKSRTFADDALKIGVAYSKSPEGPFIRLSDEPILQNFGRESRVEDPFFWYADGTFHLIIKDDTPDGKYCGEWGAGFYAESTDCLHWDIPEEAKVYGRHVRWDDKTETDQPNLERPFLLFENGRPRCFYFATGEGDAAYRITHSYNIAVPVEQEK